MLWKCIGWIILSVNYRKKVYIPWGRSYRTDYGKETGQIYRDVCCRTDLLRVSCHLYYFNYCWLLYSYMLFYTHFAIYWMCLWVVTSIPFTGLKCFVHKVQGVQRIIDVLICLSKSKGYRLLLESTGDNLWL